MGEGRASRILVGLGDLRRAFEPAPEPDEVAAGPDPVAQAHEQGRSEGEERERRRAEEAFGARAEQMRQETTSALKRLTDLHEALTREHKELMLELALEAAARICRERIEADDPVAARALQEALDALPGSSTFQARMHPDDMESVRRDLADEIERRCIELVSDESVSRGGCIVDGDRGTIDATLETATAAVRDAANGRSETP